MEGVARLIPSKSSTQNSTSSSNLKKIHVLDNHEDFDRDTPFSYDTAIPVMESSGQDVLELEMNHNIGYLDAREFGRASSFDSLSAPAYTDEYSDVSYDNLGAPSSYQYPPEPEANGLIESEPNKNIQMIDRNRIIHPQQQQQQMSEMPIDHTAYSQPPSTEQPRHENNNHNTGHLVTNLPAQAPRQIQVYAVKTENPSSKPATTFNNFGRSMSSSTTMSTSTLSTTTSTSATSHKRSSGRSQTKKEPLDPNMVEEEVARNVSQILSLTKQHRAAMEANSRQGGAAGGHLAHLPQRTPPPLVNRVVYTCPDCNKQVSSTRNLSRHRQSCPASRKFAQQPPQATITTQPLPPASTLSAMPMTQNGPNPQMVTVFLRKEDGGYPDWCSPRSSSVSTASSVRDAISHPPSRDEGSVIPPIQSTGSSHDLSFSDHLDEHMGPPTDMNNYGNHSYSSNSMLDDSQGYSMSLEEDRPPSDELGTSGESGSASRSSDVQSQAQAFQCEACQKTVASLRSLKRHHTTCKPFAQQFPHILEQEKAEAEVRKKKYEEQRMNALESGRKRIRKKPMGIDQESPMHLMDGAERFSNPGTSYPTPPFGEEDQPRADFHPMITSEYYGIPPPQYRATNPTFHMGRDPGSTYTPQLDHLGTNQVEFWSPYEGPPNQLHPPIRQTLQPMPAVTYQNLQPVQHMGQPRSLVQVTFQSPPPPWAHPAPGHQLVQMNSPVFSPGFHPMSAMSRSSSSSMAPSPMVESRAESRSGFLSPVAATPVNGPNFSLPQQVQVQQVQQVQVQQVQQVQQAQQVQQIQQPQNQSIQQVPQQLQQQEQPVESDRLPSPDSSSASNGVNQANTTCPDCQRQLCSASNLKRHRATCKAVAAGTMETPQAPPAEAPSPPKAVQWAPQTEVRNMPEQPDRRYVVLTAPPGSHVELQMDQQRPFITVGEHLKAQQQKMNSPQILQRYEPGIQVVQQGMQLGANPPPNGPIDQMHPNQQIIITQQAIPPMARHSIDGGDLPPHSAPPHLTNGPQFPAPIQRSQSTTSYPQQYVQAHGNGNHLHMNGHHHHPVNGPSHLEENGKLEEDGLLDDPHAEYEVDEHYGYGFNSATDVSDLEDELREHKDRDFHLPNGYSNGQSSMGNPNPSTETTTINGNQQHGSALRAALNSISPPARHTVSSHPLPAAVQYQTTISSAPPLDSIITTQPLPSERLVFSPQNPQHRGPEPTYYVTHVQALPNHHQPQQNYGHPSGHMTYSLAEHPMSPNMNRELGAMPATPGREVDLRFQCPECLKTYSCRKNVKRHRMAVHKLTPEEIARNPGPGDYSNGNMMQSPQMLGTPNTPVMMNSPVPSAISPNKIPRTDAQWDQQPQQSSQGRWNSALTPQQGPLQPTAQHIQQYEPTTGKNTKREPGDQSKKAAMTELAEADTTFSEDAEEGKETAKQELELSAKSVESQPMEGNSPGLAPPMTPQSSARKLINTTHTCNSCQRVLSSEYSLKRHRLSCAKGMGSQNDSIEGADPMIAQGNSVAPQPQKMWVNELKRRPQSTDGGISFEEETAPDSTTQRGGDSLAHSPCNLSSPSENGEAVLHTRKRRHSASEISAPPAKQTLKHLCQKSEETSDKGEDSESPVEKSEEFETTQWTTEQVDQEDRFHSPVDGLINSKSEPLT